MVGTTDYMSPEQVTGQAVDARTDLFSLGCTMYRLLTGAYAFPGETKADRLVRRVRADTFPSPTCVQTSRYVWLRCWSGCLPTIPTIASLRRSRRRKRSKR